MNILSIKIHSFFQLIFDIFNRLKKITKKKSAKIIIATVLIAAVGLGWLYYSRPSEQLIVSLRYGEASKGLAPDKSRFSIYEILSEEITSKVSDRIENKVDAKTLSENISVKFETNSEYTNTTFYFEYNDSSLEDSVLQALGEEYKNYFLTKYYNESAIQVSPSSENEYIIICDHFETEAKRLYRYFEKREASDKNYTDKNGITFSDLKKEAKEINDTDLRNLSAYIIENGAVLSKNRTVDFLEYQNNSMNKEYNEKMNSYNAYKKVLEMYDSEMSAIVMVPTVNSDLEYYMSRTKTGIDYLTEKAETALSDAQVLQRRIQENKQYIGNLGKEGKNEKVDALIKSISKKLSDLSAKCVSYDSEYTKQKTFDLITYKINTPPTFWFAKKAAIIGAVWLACIIFIIVKDEREKRKKEKDKKENNNA